MREGEGSTAHAATVGGWGPAQGAGGDEHRVMGALCTCCVVPMLDVVNSNIGEWQGETKGDESRQQGLGGELVWPRARA